MTSAGSVSFSDLVLFLRMDMREESRRISLVFTCQSLNLRATVNAYVRSQRFPSLIRPSFVPQGISHILDGSSILFSFAFLDAAGRLMSYSERLQASARYTTAFSRQSTELHLPQFVRGARNKSMQFHSSCIFPPGVGSFVVSSPLFSFESPMLTIFSGAPSIINMECTRASLAQFDIVFYLADVCGNRVLSSYVPNVTSSFQLIVSSTNVRLETSSTSTLTAAGSGYFIALVSSSSPDFFSFEVHNANFPPCRSPQYFHPGVGFSYSHHAVARFNGSLVIQAQVSVFDSSQKLFSSSLGRVVVIFTSSLSSSFSCLFLNASSGDHQSCAVANAKIALRPRSFVTIQSVLGAERVGLECLQVPPSALEFNVTFQGRMIIVEVFAVSIEGHWSCFFDVITLKLASTTHHSIKLQSAPQKIATDGVAVWKSHLTGVAGESFKLHAFGGGSLHGFSNTIIEPPSYADRLILSSPLSASYMNCPNGSIFNCTYTTPLLEVAAVDSDLQVDVSIGSSCYLSLQNAAFVYRASVSTKANFRNGSSQFQIQGTCDNHFSELSLVVHCPTARFDGNSVVHRVVHAVPRLLHFTHVPQYVTTGISAGSSAIQVQVTDSRNRVVTSSSFRFLIASSDGLCDVYFLDPVVSSNGSNWLFRDLVLDSRSASVSSCCVTVSLLGFSSVPIISACFRVDNGPIGLTFSNASLIQVSPGGLLSAFSVTAVRGLYAACERCTGRVCVSAIDEESRNVAVAGQTCKPLDQSAVTYNNVAIKGASSSFLRIIATYQNLSWQSAVIHVVPYAASVSFNYCNFTAVASQFPLSACSLLVLDQNGAVLSSYSRPINLSHSSALCSLNVSRVTAFQGIANLSTVSIGGTSAGVRLVASVFDGAVILSDSLPFNVYGNCSRVTFTAMSSMFVLGSETIVSAAVRDINGIFCGNDNHSTVRFSLVQGSNVHHIGTSTSINGVATINFTAFGSVAPADLSASANGGKLLVMV